MEAYHDVIFISAEERDGNTVLSAAYKRLVRKDFFNKVVINSVVNLQMECIDNAREALQNADSFLAYLKREITPHINTYLHEHQQEKLKNLNVQHLDKKEDLQSRLKTYLMELAESPLEEAVN